MHFATWHRPGRMRRASSTSLKATRTTSCRVLAARPSRCCPHRGDIARGKIQRAQGDAARFGRLEAEYRKNPEVTRSRLYLETMEEVLPRLRKTVVDDKGNLDLTIIRRSPDRRAASP